MAEIADLTPDQLAALRAIDSPTIANAIEEFDVRDRRAGYMDGSIRCIYPELGEIVGYAYTVTFKDRGPDDPPLRQAWVEALEHALELPAPRILVARDASPDVPAALFGEIMCTLLTRLDFAGVITDGTVRDLNEVRQLGLQYFASGVIVSHGQVTVESFATPVTVAGLTVSPGDLLTPTATASCRFRPQLRLTLPPKQRKSGRRKAKSSRPSPIRRSRWRNSSKQCWDRRHMAKREQYNLSEELQDIADELRAIGQTGFSMRGGRRTNMTLPATSAF